MSPWLGHTATFLGPGCLHPVTPWVTPGRAQVTSEEELQVGVQVTAARSLGQAQEPPECGLEGLLQHLGGQSGAAGSSRPPRPRPPGVSLPCPGVRVGTGCRVTARWASFLQGRSVEQLQHGPPSRGARRPPSSGASASGGGAGLLPPTQGAAQSACPSKPQGPAGLASSSPHDQLRVCGANCTHQGPTQPRGQGCGYICRTRCYGFGPQAQGHLAPAHVPRGEFL